MGMFDTIVIDGLKLKPSKDVEAYLMHNNANIKEFQTKDLECILSTYKIDSKGQIFVQVAKPTGRKKKYVSLFDTWRDERPFLERMYLKIKDKNYTLPRRLVDEHKFIFEKTKITKEFDMYSYDEIGGRYVSITYKLKAVNGIVKKSELIESEIESEKEAKKRRSDKLRWDTKINEQISNRRKLHSKWYYPIIKETYNPLVFFASKLVQHLCSKLTNATYRWHGL